MRQAATEIYLHSIGQVERDAMRVLERVTENSHTDAHIEKEKGSTLLQVEEFFFQGIGLGDQFL